MGDPRKQRKKYETLKFPWRTDVLQQELQLLGQFGLRNKKELWRHKTMLSRFRGIARSLLGMSSEERKGRKNSFSADSLASEFFPKKRRWMTF